MKLFSVTFLVSLCGTGMWFLYRLPVFSSGCLSTLFLDQAVLEYIRKISACLCLLSDVIRDVHYQCPNAVLLLGRMCVGGAWRKGTCVRGLEETKWVEPVLMAWCLAVLQNSGLTSRSLTLSQCEYLSCQITIKLKNIIFIE